MIKFPSKVTNILTLINNQGYEAYLVGGCVRDYLLGIETKDFDINTNATIEVLSKLFIDYSPMIYETYGNVAFKVDDYSIDITRFRKEGKYRKHRYPSSISFDASLKDDLQRRDFTINAIIYHPDHGVGDLTGGLDALKKQELKTISNPYLSLNEDYLRMLRLVRFSSKLNFSIEPHTMQVLKEHYYRVSHLGLGQIETEFLGFLDTEHFQDFVLDLPWTMTDIIPELKEAQGFDQNNVYHNYDLFEHTIRTIGHCDTLELKVAALFHDLGKLRTKKVNKDGSFSFPRHSSESLKIVNRYFSEWVLSGLSKDTIRKLILLHDLSIPVDYIEMKKLVHLNSIDFMRKLVALKRADNLAKSDNAAYQVEKCNQYDALLDRIEKEAPALKVEDLEISGDELGVEPHLRKQILDTLIMGVIEEKIENKKDILSKEVLRMRNELY